MNKRQILLLVMVVIALFAAVIPALAAPSPLEQIISFERDADDDGEPDYWDLEGNVYWVCFDRWLYHGHCGVIFNQSTERAAVYFRYTENGFSTNEEGFPHVFHAAVVARELANNRVFMGYGYQLKDGSTVKVYGKIPGGTYKGWIHPNGILDNNGNGLDEPDSEPVAQIGGIVALPGHGRILVDYADFNP